MVKKINLKALKKIFRDNLTNINNILLNDSIVLKDFRQILYEFL